MLRMLVVDDEEGVLLAVRTYFGLQGYHVDCARQAQHAQALLAQGDYSLVIADLRLGDFGSTEGLEIVSAARRRLPRARVILLTADGSPEIEREAVRRGADHVLQKPQSLPEVGRLLSEAVAPPRHGGSTP